MDTWMDTWMDTCTDMCIDMDWHFRHTCRDDFGDRCLDAWTYV